MIEILGLAIHEPDVALTDLALAVEAAVFAYLLAAIAFVRALREPSPTWMLLLAGLFLSFAAAALQFFGIGLHPRYFNANALYHLVQGIGLAALFAAFRRAVGPAPPDDGVKLAGRRRTFKGAGNRTAEPT